MSQGYCTDEHLLYLAFDEAREQAQKGLEPGTIIAHPDHELAHELLCVEKGTAICSLPDGTRHEFPVDEIVDANVLKECMKQGRFARSLLNLDPPR